VVVGVVAGSQFAVSLITRLWAGHHADTRGAKRAVVVGLIAGAVAGLLYLLSLRFVGTPVMSIAILLLGRALLGGAESFIITGALSWGLALVGAQSAGRVIAWVGMAMFAALALGAPLGTMLYERAGFATVALATTLLPLVTAGLVAPLSQVPRRGSSSATCPTSAAAPGSRSSACSSRLPGSRSLRWHRARSWRRPERRLPVAAMRWSIRDSGSKRCVARRPKAAVSRWGPTRPFSMWRSASARRRWAWRRAAPASVRRSRSPPSPPLPLASSRVGWPAGNS
jgi:MFS family permease